MPSALAHWFLPTPAPNGKPLCGFGRPWNAPAFKMVRSTEILRESLRPELAQLARESASWTKLQRETGGDLSRVGGFTKSARHWPACCWMKRSFRW